jgi:hypothetical protein
MTNTPPVHPAESHRDRSTGLIIFGAAEILVGLGCASLIPLTFVTAALSPAVDLQVVLPTLALNGLIAAVFVTLGIGSIRARRWAVALTLSLSWVWLLTGIATMALSWWLLPGFFRSLGAASGLDAGTAGVVALIINLCLSAIYVVLPGAFVLFYRSPDVAATCHARDPRPGWTDRCPQRLLALTVAYALGGLSIVAMPAYGFVFPFFGRVLTGASGAVCWGIVLVLSGAVAWGTSRRDPWAWWTAVAAACIGGVSSAVTFAVIDPEVLFQIEGLLAEQRTLLEGFWPSSAWIHVAVQALIWGSLVAYLFVVKPLFNPPLGSGEIEP